MTNSIDDNGNSLVTRLLRSRHILSAVFVLSLLESTILFIPLETLLIPLMQLNREKLWRLATAALLGCLCGALLGYHAGTFLLSEFNQNLVAFFGSQADFDAAQSQLGEQGFVYIFLAGVTPIPFQVAMLMAGAVAYPVGLFLLATLMARSIRYFGLAALVYYFGNQASELLNRYKKPAVIALSSVAALVLVLSLWPEGQI